MDKTALLIQEMIRYDAGAPQRIQHFMKVHDFSRTIGLMEGLDAHQQLILETAAVIHDIGIKNSLEKYGDCNGPHQEEEGPPEARSMLEKLGYLPDVIDRVCHLVAHHHTYTDMDGSDHQILVEADFLVNLYEGESSIDMIRHTYDTIFRTETGKGFCAQMFGLDP